MSQKVNPVSHGFREQAHLNWMTGPSYFLDNPLHTLQMVAASCFFGEPSYYSDESLSKQLCYSPDDDESCFITFASLRETLQALDPQEWRSLTHKEVLEQSIDKALAFSPEETLKLAAEIRQKWLIRVTPQVILVRAANFPSLKGTGLVRKWAREIVRRSDEVTTGMAYQLSVFGKPIPNALKRSWSDFLTSQSEYSLAKYRQERRQVKMVDVVNLTHSHSSSIQKLMTHQLTTTDQTWEAVLSQAGKQGGVTRQTWESIIPKMGHMALLRNLRNFLDKDVPTSVFLSRLTDQGAVLKGKQLPFRYWSAYKAVTPYGNPQVLDALENCLTLSLGELPIFSGRVMSLCDNSGSAQNSTLSSMSDMSVAEVGNLTGLLTGIRSEEGYVGVFGDLLEIHPVRKLASIMSQMHQLDILRDNIGQSTETGIWLFWRQALEREEHWDHVFVYSDMQAGHGGLYTEGDIDPEYRIAAYQRNYIDVPKLIAAYRAKVNPKVNVYLAQIAGYSDSILPEFFYRTVIFGGWSSGLLHFAAEMSKQFEEPECLISNPPNAHQ
jgi:hypothetical protein